MKKNQFAKAQQLGRALMLPIAVLPVAGLLLRLGQPDLLDLKLVAQAGDAIFANLALIFAIGVAVGFAKENHGVAGLSGAIGYLVMVAVLKAYDPAINMGVLAGIIAGAVAGSLYNRYKDIQLPQYLAFFGGKRFVAIATGLACLALALVFAVIWPPLQRGIDTLGHWLLGAGAVGLFLYGALNRLLVVTGLHHIMNSLVWFVFGNFEAAGKVATGDLNRFFAGDPTAGMFMSGFFPVMMFGLPAACLAMYRRARPENRRAVGGLLLSMALTSFLTGVTEPIEFAFMFLAPALYAVHAVLTGLSMALMHLLGVRLGFTFSAGAFDYVLSYGLSTKGWMLLPLGLVYFGVYYGAFSWAIGRWKLQTPGREAAGEAAATFAPGASASERARAFVVALGGAGNLLSVDACTTRLRLQVARSEAIDDAALKALGSRGIVRPAAGSVQVVLGPEADMVADAIRTALREPGAGGSAPAQAPRDPGGQQPTGLAPSAAKARPDSTPGPQVDRDAWLAALGGEANVRLAEAVATTRLRLELGDLSRLDEPALARLGAAGVMKISEALVHVVAGAQAQAVADALASSGGAVPAAREEA